MKRTFITILSILITCFVFGQDKINFDFTKDYDSILKLTKQKTSKLFYNNLFKRFQKADSTLTNYELDTRIIQNIILIKISNLKEKFGL